MKTKVNSELVEGARTLMSDPNDPELESRIDRMLDRHDEAEALIRKFLAENQKRGAIISAGIDEALRGVEGQDRAIFLVMLAVQEAMNAGWNDVDWFGFSTSAWYDIPLIKRTT